MAINIYGIKLMLTGKISFFSEKLLNEMIEEMKSVEKAYNSTVDAFRGTYFIKYSYPIKDRLECMRQDILKANDVVWC